MLLSRVCWSCWWSSWSSFDEASVQLWNGCTPFAVHTGLSEGGPLNRKSYAARHTFGFLSWSRFHRRLSSRSSLPKSLSRRTEVPDSLPPNRPPTSPGLPSPDNCSVDVGNRSVVLHRCTRSSPSPCKGCTWGRKGGLSLAGSPSASRNLTAG